VDHRARQYTCPGRRLTRREFLGAGTAGLAGAVAAACGTRPTEEPPTPAQQGRLLARPAEPIHSVSPGLQSLELAPGRDGQLYVPAGYRPEQPAPLVLMLHGAGGSAQGGMSPFRSLADAAGFVLLAPDSRGRTWDMILGGYGPDVAFIDYALSEVFGKVAIDPARLAIEGFSDGASYALSLGITNGDLFSRIVAFSPGFMSPAARRGEPSIYVSHGTQDQILPIDLCSRRIVGQLEASGYTVSYHEFDGGHTVPASIASEAADWLSTGWAQALPQTARA
jgi:phospholipase/carboxylesterase